MNSPIPFVTDDYSIRIIQIDGEFWFVGKDVAKALGYADTVNAIKQHCKGVVKYHPIATAGGTQDVRILSEGDVFRLIVNSNLESAQPFERWVFDDVLPSLRKTGTYHTSHAAPVGDTGPAAVKAALHAARLFSPFFRINRQVGCSRDLAAINANLAVKTLTGVDLLDLLGCAPLASATQGTLFEATEGLAREGAAHRLQEGEAWLAPIFPIKPTRQ